MQCSRRDACYAWNYCDNRIGFCYRNSEAGSCRVGAKKQIEELKTLRDEIDMLISNLIKSRKELEVSELNNLVKEVKISRGEIKADDISVKTTEKKILVSIGDRPVSVEPTESRVLIRDKGLEVNASEVMIKENVLSVGGADADNGDTLSEQLPWYNFLTTRSSGN